MSKSCRALSSPRSPGSSFQHEHVSSQITCLQDVMRDLLSEFYEDALESLEKQIQKAKQPRITHETPDYPKDPASEFSCRNMKH